MEQLNHLPPTRRLVTGHDRDGKAIFEFDDLLTPVNPTPKSARSDPSTPQPVGATLIHRTREYPVKIQGGREELTVDNIRRGQGEKGIVCQIVDVPPTPDGTKPYLHRNESLDYGVVLKGPLQLLLDDGAVETLREGDVYIQKGTFHAWLNNSNDYCRFLTVVIPSQKVKVEATGELLEVTKIPGLSD
ncbi:hypothetical protein Z517_03868 [Fonsecaea pedrosoi CBS 271.37]|uniref:Cupin type-2 domain-containing protein n=1 Tax=Fonsecaea pedrosoi CBS 271.37 TaxID=1442368 RepID=A0A0D2GQJ1_9EURO|nr:uncharacterized protein Z517_03868 [Fonsecaea pedrosoi CBS 271.37]KIW80845.1 hypothetical protein Z517_03868 [Fonsecaea pedrosoi CBS 271.37]